MERKYSITEIDLMRDAVRKKVGYPSLSYEARSGEWSHLTPDSRVALDSYNHHVEDVLRTYLIAGIDPQDLVESVSLQHRVAMLAGLAQNGNPAIDAPAD